jgi:hypothetical protein
MGSLGVSEALVRGPQTLKIRSAMNSNRRVSTAMARTVEDEVTL